MKFEKEIIELYNLGYQCKDIIRVLDCGRSHVYNVLKNNNITLKSEYVKKKKSRFSDIDIDNMYKMYQQGKTLLEVAEKYETSSSNVRCLFCKKQYEIRCNGDAHRKYNINENFFDNIDSQEKAYILGLIYADGCNNDKKNSIHIDLQETDKYILEDIKKIIGTDKPLYVIHSTYPGGQDMYRLELISKHMCKTLSNIGATPRKSNTLTFPNINSDLIRHFVRGYFDGDGYISKPEKRGCQIEIMGTLMFCESLYEILHNISIDCYVKNTNKPETITRYLVIGKKNECEKFCNYIYNDATIYMNRKFDKAFQKFHSTFNLSTNNECTQ